MLILPNSAVVLNQMARNRTHCTAGSLVSDVLVHMLVVEFL